MPLRNLRAAFAQVKRESRQRRGGPRDGRDVRDATLEENLKRLSKALRDGHATDRRRSGGYGFRSREPGAAPAGDSDGARPSGADRVAARAGADLRAGLCSPQLRVPPAARHKDALRRVDELLNAGYVYVVDADLKATSTRFRTSRCGAGAGEGRRRASAGADRSVSRAGRDGRAGAVDARGGDPARSGASVPLLANIYLDPLDHRDGRGGLRDGAVCGRLRDPVSHAAEAQQALALVRALDGGGRPDAASREDADRGLPRSEEASTSWAITSSGAIVGRARRACQKLKDTIRQQDQAHQRAQPGGHHRGRQPHAQRAGLSTSSTATGDRLRGLDDWIRMRLRSILRKRQQAPRARSRGRDHQRWPNAFFATQGLFSFTAAHASGPSILSRGDPLNWRAGCGRSARPVRREGERNQSRLPTPIRSRTGRRARSLIRGFVSRSDPAEMAGLRCRPARRIVPTVLLAFYSPVFRAPARQAFRWLTLHLHKERFRGARRLLAGRKACVTRGRR